MGNKIINSHIRNRSDESLPMTINEAAPKLGGKNHNISAVLPSRRDRCAMNIYRLTETVISPAAKRH